MKSLSERLFAPDQGIMDPALLYDPPFTDIAATGPDDLFGDERVTRRFAKIETI